MIHRCGIVILVLAMVGCLNAEILTKSQTAFVGGELSPLVVGRQDVAQYPYGCRTLENMLVVDAGAATRRMGSLYVGTAPGQARLEPFVYDDNDVYIMEFSHQLLRFYREVAGTPGIVLDANSVAYDVNTPWDGNDVFDLNIYQKGDILYVAHRDYSPRKISRFGHTSWTIEDCNDLITDGPFKDENTDTSITIDPPDAAADVTSGETYDANDVFITYAASEAFDDTLTLNNGWMADEVADTWLRVRYAAAKTITKVKIWPCINISFPARNLRHCKIEASNNGTTWTKLSATRWYGKCQGYLGDEIEFSEFAAYADYGLIYLDNDTAYTQYRIWCYDNWGDASYTTILEVEMTESDSDTFTANSDIWEAGHVGSLWKLRHPREASEVSGSFATFAQSSNSIEITSDWDFETSGVWAATLVLERSYDYGATWEAYRTWDRASTDGQIVATGIEEESNVWYRVRMSSYTLGTVNYSLSTRDGIQTGIIRIASYVDANEVTADILTELGSRDVTYRWSEGAWSEEEGYPAAVTGHQSRLVFAKDLTIWWSATNQFDTFKSGTNDDDAFWFTLSQSRQNPILWVIGDMGQSFAAGTMGKILEIQPFDETVGFTPTNPPKVQASVAVGSSSVHPAAADELVLFASHSGTRVHELGYNPNAGSVRAPDLTLLSSHILGSGVSQLAWQTTPYPYLWSVRKDGELATMYYSSSYGIVAWTRQVTDGIFTSVAVAPRADDNDRVWCVVKRTINGSDAYYVECFSDLDMDTGTNFLDSSLSFDGGDAVSIVSISKANPGAVTLSSWPSGLTDGDQILLDGIVGMTELNGVVLTADDCNSTALTLTLDLEDGSGNFTTASLTTYSSGGTLQIVEDSFGGLSHLEGETVRVIGDGVYAGEYEVSGGSVTLDSYYNEVVVGLAYTSTIVPVEVDTIGRVGSTASSSKKVTHVMLNVYETAGGKYGASSATLYRIPWKQQSGSGVDDPSYRWTGPYAFPLAVGPRRDATYTIVQDEPYPMTLRGIECLFSVGN